MHTSTPSMRQRRSVTVATALLGVVAAVLVAGAPSVAGQPEKPVDVQILSINDFHGNLVYDAVIGGVPVGGVEYLATHVHQLEATNPNTVLVSGGDLIGASPLLSAMFHDEPTIEAMNAIGMDLAVVGNHEFDEGWRELLRLQRGECHPSDGCLDGDGFDGADFPYLAANVIVDRTGKTLFKPYRILTFDGARVAFIGVVLQGTPNIVTATGVDGLTFLDEVESVNALVPEITKRHVEAIVVLMHEGAYSCSGEPLQTIVNGFDDEVDVVITGHTHSTYVCDIDGKLVTSAHSNGRRLTEIDLTVDARTDEITAKSATTHLVTRDVDPDPAMTSLIAKYDAVSAPVANAPVGAITADLTRAANAAGESALGDVITDAQLEATATNQGAVAALTNPGGIREDLSYASSAAGEGDGVVTYGEAFKVQPFSNYLVSLDLTGAQLKAVLEQQSMPGTVLQVSNGFTYTWSVSAPAGSRVANLAIGGVPVDPAATYRITVNNFLADGGDGFTAMLAGTNRYVGQIDLDAFVAYLGAHSPVAPGPQNRITLVP